MRNNASNVSTLKNDNRALIFSLLRKQPMSRAQLSAETNLTKSAVTMITATLIQEGQLKEVGTSDTQIGRKPILLDIVKNYRYAVGVSLHRKRLIVSITDLGSNLIDSEENYTAQYQNSSTALRWICDTIQLLLCRNKISYNNVIGIGISSPGPLDYQTGTILMPPNFSLFHNCAIVSRMKQEFDLPILLENNSVLLAVTEYFCGSMGNYRNSMFVTIADGIGSCILQDGHIYRGFAGYAGELGHTSIDCAGELCSCGNRGCLELYATMAALKGRFGFDDYKKLVDEAYVGNNDAMKVIDYQASRLVCSFIGSINMFDLDSVILYGEFNYRPQLLFSKLNEMIDRQCMIRKAHSVEVLPSQLGTDAAAISSTSAVLNRYFEQQL